MKTQHTPGPWNLITKRDPDVGMTWYVESETAPGIIAEGQNNPQDARLIAAAPKLLTALKEALTLLEYMAADRESAKQHKTLVAARDAIAQAEGTQ